MALFPGAFGFEAGVDSGSTGAEQDYGLNFGGPADISTFQWIRDGGINNGPNPNIDPAGDTPQFLGQRLTTIQLPGEQGVLDRIVDGRRSVAAGVISVDNGNPTGDRLIGPRVFNFNNPVSGSDPSGIFTASTLPAVATVPASPSGTSITAASSVPADGSAVPALTSVAPLGVSLSSWLWIAVGVFVIWWFLRKK